MDLPKDWALLEFNEIFDIYGGNATPKGESLSRTGEIPFVRMQDLGRVKENIYLTETKNYISAKALDKNKLKIFPAGVILIPRSGSVHLNHRAILGQNSSVVSHIAILQPKGDRFNNLYLYYMLKLVDMHQIMHQTTGLNLIRFEDLKKMKLPVPFPTDKIKSKQTQDLVVSDIEKQLTKIDKSVQTMKQLKTRLEIYKKAVLKKAFNTKNLDKKSKSAKLGEVFKIGTGATPRRGEKKYYSGGDISWITSGAVNESVIDESKEYITELALKETNCKVYPKGSLVIAMYGEGKTRGKVSELGINAATNQACAVIIYDKTAAINKSFLKLFLKTKYEFMRLKASGGVQPNLNLSHIKNMEIVYPVDINEQTKVVEEIESRFSIIDKLEQTIASSLFKAELLRKSILKSAFEGKLGGGLNDRS